MDVPVKMPNTVKRPVPRPLRAMMQEYRLIWGRFDRALNHVALEEAKNLRLVVIALDKNHIVALNSFEIFSSLVLPAPAKITHNVQTVVWGDSIIDLLNDISVVTLDCFLRHFPTPTGIVFKQFLLRITQMWSSTELQYVPVTQMSVCRKPMHALPFR
jgi:hypothetical protein